MPHPLPFDEVVRAIRASRSVFLTVHQRPDGDALGSQIAIAIACTRLGLKVTMANEDPVPARYRFLPWSRRIRTGAAELPRRFDLAFTLECATPERAGVCGAVARRAKVLVNMDHHLGNRGYGDINLVDATMPAEILLAETLRIRLGVPLTRDIATAFYVGLYTETGGFRYNNTTAEVLNLASRLVEAGVNPREVGEAVYECFPVRRLRLLGRSLGTLAVADGVAWMSLARKDFTDFGATEVDAEDFVEYPRAIGGVCVAVFLRETPQGDVRASLRAKMSLPLHRIAQRFGGGGHAYAAGCTLEHMTIAEARRKLAPALRAAMRRQKAR
ncbi:MAG: DHH family phosphoesterase [Candidatus Coatesbacteria bacterium]